MRVMVIGASTDPAKYGHKAVRAYLNQGHDVLPVHPHAAQIAGIAAYPDVAAVPGPIDRVTMYLPPAVGIDLLEPLATRGDVREVWLNPGAESDDLIEKARTLGLEPIVACSIVAIGERPGEL